MLTLSAPTFDTAGHIRLHPLPSSDLRSISRRVNRVKTLDGGVVINDGGFAHGDRTFGVRFRPASEAEYQSVSRLAQLYPEIVVSTRNGVYRASVQNLTLSGAEATLILLIKSREE